MKFVITESDKIEIRKQYGFLLTEAPSPPIEAMGNRVNEKVDDLVEKLKRTGVVDGANKAGVNIIEPIEQLKNYVLSLLPKKLTDMTTTGKGGNQFKINVQNKIFELAKSEVSKIPLLKRKTAKVLMLAKYGGKEKYIQEEMKNWGGIASGLIWDLLFTPSNDLFGVNMLHLDRKNPQHQKWVSYSKEMLNDHFNNKDAFLKQLLGLIWDSL